MGILDYFMSPDESEYEDYYDDINWKTWRPDASIYKRRHFPNLLRYCRELQYCYEQLLEEASDNYIYDIETIKEQYNRLHLKNCELEKKLAVAEGRNEILQMRLDSALEWQTATGRKNEVYTAEGMDPEPVPEKTEKSKGGKFESKSGASKQENMMLAAAYLENGWTVDEIAKDLKLSPASIKSYISTINKHYQVQNIQGRRWIIFDKAYGSNKWDLALYARLEDKFPDSV